MDLSEDINPAKDDLKTPLHVAAEKGHLKICQLIISKIDHNHPRDSDGQIPLHLAADNGHFKVCKMFMRMLEDKNPADGMGWTVLHNAASNGHRKVCQMIMENIEGVSNFLNAYIIWLFQSSKIIGLYFVYIHILKGELKFKICFFHRYSWSFLKSTKAFARIMNMYNLNMYNSNLVNSFLIDKNLPGVSS